MENLALIIAIVTIGIFAQVNGAEQNRTGKPDPLPPGTKCPSDCPVGVYKCQEIKLDATLINLLVLTNQIPIKLSVHDLIYVNCKLPNDDPIPCKTCSKGGPNPPTNGPTGTGCTSGCPNPWKYVCCKNDLITLNVGIGPIGPVPRIKNLILLCRGLDIDVGDVTGK